jgi:microtubule-associated protein-like 6
VIPFVCVWDTRDMTLVKRVDYEEGMRAIVATAFSPDGRYLSAVATDNNHTIYVHDWQKGKLVFTGRGAVGEPPQVG